MDQHPVKRRTFLSSAAGGAAIVTSNPFQAVLHGETPRGLASLQADHFQNLIGDEFFVSHCSENQPRTSALTLQEVTRHDHPGDLRPGFVRPAGFSLLFASAAGHDIANATHMVLHAELGELPIFLHRMRVDNDESGYYYEAVFN